MLDRLTPRVTVDCGVSQDRSTPLHLEARFRPIGSRRPTESAAPRRPRDSGVFTRCVMQISARVIRQNGQLQSMAQTEGKVKSLAIPVRAEGSAQALTEEGCCFSRLPLIIATTSTARRGTVDSGSNQLKLRSWAGSKARGPVEDVSYRASVKAKGDEAEVFSLMCDTDSVAETQPSQRHSWAGKRNALKAIAQKPAAAKVSEGKRMSPRWSQQKSQQSVFYEIHRE